MAFVFFIFAGQPRKFSPALKNFFAKGISVRCEIIIIMLYNSDQIVAVVCCAVGLLCGSCGCFVGQNVLIHVQDTRMLYLVLLNLRSN